MSVISENAFHVSKAVFFTTLLKEDLVSHPVRAWKKRSALEFSRPSFVCNRMYCSISIVLLDPQSNPNFANRQIMKRGNPKDYNVSIQIESKFWDYHAWYNEEHEGLAGCQLLRDYMELYQFLFYCRCLQ